MAAVLAMVTIAAFSGLRTARFVNFDDEDYITANPNVQAGLTARSIGWAFTTTACANWHPVTWLTHLADVQMFGLDAGRHHRTSVLIHTAGVVLLFLLLVRMTGALWRPAFVAALFAIHPLHVESVAWIAERKDVVSTAFWLLTVFAWLRWLEEKTAARYAQVVLLFALGLMAKPMLVTLPFTLFLLDVWPLKRATYPLLWREKLPLFAMSFASCVITFFAQRNGGAVQTLQNFPLGERLANAIVVYASYLGKTIWPAGLAVFYPYSFVGVPGWAVAGLAVSLAAATALVFRLMDKAPYLAVGWLWYLGTLVPVIGLVQIGSQSMADRYTYVPLIGIFVAVAWGVAELVSGSRTAQNVVSAIGVAIVSALFVATRAQATYWSNSTTLFEHALAVTTDNWLAHSNLGGALLDDGRIEDGIAHQREALRIRPSYTEAHYNLGLALEKTGRHTEAIQEFERALELRPSFAKAHNNLAGVLAGQGQLDAAMTHLEQAIRFEPGNTDARYNLASMLLAAGRGQEAAAQYEAVLKLKPDDVDARRELEHVHSGSEIAPPEIRAPTQIKP